MRTYKNRGKEEMKPRKAWLVSLVFLFLMFCRVQADVVWETGHHEINEGDVYGEIWMYNDCTLDIWGGDIGRLAAYDTTVTNWYDGQMNTLWARNDSTVNIFGGNLNILWAAENSNINLYAYDVTVMTTGGIYDQGYVTGYFYSNGESFYFDISQKTYQHINIVPEPISAVIDIQPDTLNISSGGKWLTCHIWLPEDYNVADVNSETVFLEDEIPAEWLWFNEKQNVVMAKFRRSDVEDIIQPGLVELTVTGRLTDGTPFEGTDTIRVLNKGNTKQLTRKHKP